MKYIVIGIAVVAALGITAFMAMGDGAIENALTWKGISTVTMDNGDTCYTLKSSGGFSCTPARR